MRPLLDTHTIIWLDTDIKRLSQLAVDLITDRQNTVFISYASLWEMQIKL
jgi:PIN domain nuclease of toxin-antitoxin system